MAKAMRVAGLSLVGACVLAAALLGQRAPETGMPLGAAAAPYDATVSRLAGPAAGPGYADGTGAAARFAYPWGVAVATDGATYVADTGNHTIRRVSAAGEVTTVAGAAGQAGAADGAAAVARFRSPSGVAVAADGTLYVCDTGNHTLRTISPAGEVTTLAGTTGQAGTADGTGAEARFSRPLRVTIDSAGNLLVADGGNHTIRLVTPAGVVTTAAGIAGEAGAADGAVGTAKLNGPSGLAVGVSSGGLLFWVADTGNHTLRRVGGPSATTSTFAGAAGSAGSADGAAATARFSSPHDIARAADLGFVVADTGNHTLRRVEATGATATLAGTAGAAGSIDGTGAAARFFEPRGVAAGDGRYLVADTGNHAIRTVTGAGAVLTLAGSAPLSGTADGAAADARFSAPSGVAAGAGGVVVADTGNHVIRAIAADGSVSTLAGTAGAAGAADGLGADARFSLPYGVAVDAMGMVFVTDRGNHTVRAISPGGVVTTLAGTAGAAGSDNGNGADARFSAPSGIALGAGGTLYVADRDGHVIRAISAAGAVTTLAGTAGAAGSDDGAGADARFDGPTGICVHPLTGDLLVADRGNRRVRVVAPSGAVTTLLQPAAGGGWEPAAFADPVAVAVDAAGAVFVADEDGHDLVVVPPGGTPRALAGVAGSPGNVDGAGAAARLFLPRGIAVQVPGVLLVADAGNHAIRTVAYEPESGGCTAPAVVTQSGDVVVPAGQAATASVTASGTPPLAFQWYEGLPGDVASPIAGATGDTFTIAALGETTTVWARVTNACGHADSGAIKLAVCAWAVAPASAAFGHAGGDGTLQVTAQATCPWTASASAEWVTFPAGASGSGDATLAYAVAPNAGAARSATITVGGRTHTVTQAALPRWYVSSVAHTPGAAGTTWRSDLAVVNRGAAAVDLTLTFWPYDGSAGVVRQHTLAAGASVEWKDVLVSLFEQAAASVKGAVQVDAGAPVHVAARTYNQAATGTYGQGYPAIPAGAGLAAGAVGYLPQLGKSAARRTNVGVLNVGAADATVAVKVFDGAGAQAGSAVEATVLPGRYWQQDDIFAAAGAGELEGAWATVEVLTAGGRVWAYASVIDNATGDPTTVAVQHDLQAGPYLVSSQAHAKGAAGTQWRSSLAVVNPGAAAAPLTLAWRPYGAAEPVVREHALAAGAAVEWADVLVSLFGADAAASVKGSVEVVAPHPVVVGSRTYNQAATGTYGQEYPAIAASQALPAGVVGVLPQLRRDAATRTNVGVLNAGGDDVEVEVRLFDAAGAPIGAVTTATVAAGRYWQQDDIFASAGAGTRPLAFATVEALTAGGRIWAYASVIDNATGDPTTVAVQAP